MVVVVIIILYVYLKYLVINNYSGNYMWLYDRIFNNFIVYNFECWGFDKMYWWVVFNVWGLNFYVLEMGIR